MKVLASLVVLAILGGTAFVSYHWLKEPKVVPMEPVVAEQFSNNSTKKKHKANPPEKAKKVTRKVTKKRTDKDGLADGYTCKDVRYYVHQYGWEDLREVAKKRGYSENQIRSAYACVN